MDRRTLKLFREVINKPNGIVLVTGPTGSGKTTTLYSALSELNDISDKLITTEDPIEYDIDGIIQVPIDASIGNTFAACVCGRSCGKIPDNILVGEIRDLETAEIAVQASLTGHMVFSTLHTNDAPSTVTRLRDMGIAAVLDHGHGRSASWPSGWCGAFASVPRRSHAQLRHAGRPGADASADIAGKKFYRGRGCEICNNTGYKGRVGLFELMIMNDDLRDMIMRNASTRRSARRRPQLRHGHAARRRHERRVRRHDHARRSRSRNHSGSLRSMFEADPLSRMPHANRVHRVRTEQLAI